MMRFKKGSKVEVFRKEDTPCGSWRCGELVSGDGRYYYVRFDDRSVDGGAAVVERTSRKFIRPCPPPVYSVRDWLPGDLVEVLVDNMSWKSAIVSKVTAAGDKYCFVKLIGSSEDVRVHKSDQVIRVRQVWEAGNGWVRVGVCEDVKSDLIKGGASTGGKRKLREEDDHFPAVNNNNNKDFEKKMRPIEKDGTSQRLGENHMHASFCNQMDTGRVEAKGDNVGDGESSSVSSSVGSCSINNRSAESMINCSYDSSDAESFCDGESEKKRCPQRRQRQQQQQQQRTAEEEDAAVVDFQHKLELYAYRCTIGALYSSSGSLSWEQEELVTNLRLTLHVTNDEHLNVLRNFLHGETIY